ncbi:MAG: hypothetical protein V5B30_11395 [Candidatus Accumulibacter delftensis]
MQSISQAVLEAPRKAARLSARKISTEELAAILLVKEQTIRAGHCRAGHYLGLVPIKCANRRLLWNADEAADLAAGQAAKAADAAHVAEHVARKAADAARLPAHIARKVAAKARRLAAENPAANADERLTAGETT